MEKEKNHQTNETQQIAVEKTGDTILVINDASHTVALVQGLDEYGNLQIIDPKENSAESSIHIDPYEEAFTNFYIDFYHQLKDPLQYSFFKVTEYEAADVAKDLQQYVDRASKEEIKDLKDHEVSIDAVEVQYGLSHHFKGSRYLYDPALIDWETMGKLGLDREKLEQLNALEPLLKGYKTPMLVPLNFKLGGVESALDARLSLRVGDSELLEVRIHGIRKAPDLNSEFYGHRFTEEDKHKLLTVGNMGRIVDLVDRISGEVFPALISRDRLTNELVPYRAEGIVIPDVIKGVRLDDEQKQVLKEGKVLFVEDMISRRGTLFSANVQFNAEKRYVEFLFERNIKSLGLKDKLDVPKTFRGKVLRGWQVEKLRNGEVAYVDGLEDRKGKKYQGYVSFDRGTGKFSFSFKNPGKEKEVKKESSVKRKGRKM